jgi:hypothetical protein
VGEDGVHAGAPFAGGFVLRIRAGVERVQLGAFRQAAGGECGIAVEHPGAPREPLDDAARGLDAASFPGVDDSGREIQLGGHRVGGETEAESRGDEFFGRHRGSMAAPPGASKNICLLRGGGARAYGACRIGLEGLPRMWEATTTANPAKAGGAKPGGYRGSGVSGPPRSSGRRTVFGEGLAMCPADAHTDETELPQADPAAARLPVLGPVRISMPPTQAAERFAAGLRAAVATGATDAGSLREAVRAFARSRRDAGDAPERALIAVKERVGDALRRRPGTPKSDASALLRRVVHWAIEAYYRAD